MPTRNVVLTDHQQALIETLVETGRYQNASEIMREGLRMVERQESEDAAKLKALREAVGVGLDDIRRGDFKEFSDIDGLVSYLDGVADRIVSRYPAD